MVLCDELQFWQQNIHYVSGCKITGNHAVTKLVFSQACKHSYGGYILQKLGNEIAHGTFPQEEREKSSTYRGLAVVKYTLHSFSGLFSHQVVLWHSDNLNTARIIRNGRATDSPHALALEVFRFCLRHYIHIISQWVPREENELADSISKYCDTDNWVIDGETFHFIQSQFGFFYH